MLHRVTTKEREEIQQSCIAKSEMLDICTPLYQSARAWAAVGLISI